MKGGVVVLEIPEGICHHAIIVVFDANIPSGLDKELHHLKPTVQFYYPSKTNKFNPERGRSPLRMRDPDLFSYVLEVIRNDYPNHHAIFITFDKKFKNQIEDHPERNAMRIICKPQINDRKMLAELIEAELRSILAAMARKLL